MPLVGERYTWENGRVKERLDWALCNLEWSLKFPQTKNFHLLKHGSDHRAIFLAETNNINKEKTFYLNAA